MVGHKERKQRRGSQRREREGEGEREGGREGGRRVHLHIPHPAYWHKQQLLGT